MMGERRMPEIPQPAELDRLIRALSKWANDCFKRQHGRSPPEVRAPSPPGAGRRGLRDHEGAGNLIRGGSQPSRKTSICSMEVQRLSFSPLEPIRFPGLVSKRPARLGLVAGSSENKLATQGALARVMLKLRNRVVGFAGRRAIDWYPLRRVADVE
jgi:hypothetical protein